MTNSNPNGLKPSFDVEFPDSERNLPDNIEHAIEQGVLTPAMVGYRSSDSGEIELPLSSGEVDELRVRAEQVAKITGRNPDDHDWRFQ